MAKRPIHLAKVYYKVANNKTTNKKWLSRVLGSKGSKNGSWFRKATIFAGSLCIRLK